MSQSGLPGKASLQMLVGAGGQTVGVGVEVGVQGMVLVVGVEGGLPPHALQPPLLHLPRPHLRQHNLILSQYLAYSKHLMAF